MKTSTKVLLAIIIFLVLALVLVGGFFLGLQLLSPNASKQTPTLKTTAQTTPQVSEVPTTSSTSFQGFATADVGLNMRDQAATSGLSLQLVPYAAKIAIDGESGDFYHGAYQGKSGYLSKQYISKTDPLSTWKTYSSQTYAFSVKYPGDWTITKDEYIADPIRYLHVEFGPNMTLGVDFPMGFEEATTVSESTVDWSGTQVTKSLIQNPDNSRLFIVSQRRGDINYFFVVSATDNAVFKSRLLDLILSTWQWK